MAEALAATAPATAPASAGEPSIADLLRIGAARLARGGIDTPRLDAELLLAQTLACDRARLVLEADSPVSTPVAASYAALIARREAREPVAYILGRKDFSSITVAVDRSVLIPRPETELLVEVGLELPHGARVVDVGTGSGAVALALKREREDLTVTGTDVSEPALAVARANAAALGIDVEFVRSDLLAAIATAPDAVLANLPYVPSAELLALAPEIRSYEPSSALDGGPDGLDLVRRLVASADGVALLALELGAGQADAVDGSLRRAGFAIVERRRDLAGHDRVIVGRR